MTGCTVYLFTYNTAKSQVQSMHLGTRLYTKCNVLGTMLYTKNTPRDPMTLV